MSEAIAEPVVKEEVVEPVIQLTPLEKIDLRLNNLSALYSKKVQAMFPKIQAEGWFYVPSGEVLPKKYEEVLVVIDKRISQEGDQARALGKDPVMRVRHGYVSKVGYSSHANEWFIETVVLRAAVDSKLNKGGVYTNGYPDHVMFWKPMPKLPPMPKFLKEDFYYSK